MAKKSSRVATAEQVATLIRIYRSAAASGDVDLKNATAIELSKHGIQSADLAPDKSGRDSRSTKGGDQ